MSCPNHCCRVAEENREEIKRIIEYINTAQANELKGMRVTLSTLQALLNDIRERFFEDVEPRKDYKLLNVDLDP